MTGLVGAFLAFALSATWAAFLGAILGVAGNGLAWPTFQARVAEIAGDDDQGAVQGAASAAGSLASILGLVAGGLLYPTLGVGLLVAGAAIFTLVAIATPVWFRDRPTGSTRSPDDGSEHLDDHLGHAGGDHADPLGGGP
jgi:MFS family permease